MIYAYRWIAITMPMYYNYNTINNKGGYCYGKCNTGKSG